MMSAPDTPSTRQWCVFEIKAKRPSARPSATQISHRGFDRSSYCDMIRAVSLLSLSMLPGGGIAV